MSANEITLTTIYEILKDHTARFDGIDIRLDGIDKRLDNSDKCIDSLEAPL